MKNQDAPSIYECSQCDQTFVMDIALTKHYLVTHKLDISKIEAIDKSWPEEANNWTYVAATPTQQKKQNRGIDKFLEWQPPTRENILYSFTHEANQGIFFFSKN